ncbi:MAG: hypothetical protein CSA05_02695 [Bacteroidia bacterium]|nr:MAG: hypothetical protein CSA05_02695 [Bacteroidia bacterium]
MRYIFVAFIFCHFWAYGQIGGIGTYKFLELPNSARVAGMGGNLISVVDNDLNLAYHNPALLNEEMDKQLALNYINYLLDINFGYAAYAHHFDKIGQMAFGIHYINYGEFTGANETGTKNGTFTAAEYALNIIWAKPLIDSLLTVGVNIKPIISNLENYSSYGIACDIGLHYYNKNALFGIALLVKNAGHQLKPYYEEHYEPLPIDVQLGFSKRLAHAPFRFSLTFQHLQKWDMQYEIKETKRDLDGFGEKNEKSEFENFSDNFLRHTVWAVEFLPGKNFHLRMGYNHQRRKELVYDPKPGFTGLSWGVGLKIAKFFINYARASYHIAGASNHFSISTNLSHFYSK